MPLPHYVQMPPSPHPHPPPVSQPTPPEKRDLLGERKLVTIQRLLNQGKREEPRLYSRKISTQVVKEKSFIDDEIKVM